MTTKSELLNKIEELKKQVEQIEEAAAVEKAETTWMPEENEDFYFLSETGVSSWKNNEQQMDSMNFSRQDPFKTQEEAEKADERRMAIVQVNRQVRELISKQHPGWVANWSDVNQEKHFPVYCFGSKRFSTACKYITKTQFLFDDAPIGVYEQIDEQLLLTAIGIEK